MDLPGGAPHLRGHGVTDRGPCLGQGGIHMGSDSLSWVLSGTHIHPTQPGLTLSLEPPPAFLGSVFQMPLSSLPKPHLHQAAAFTLGTHKQPCGEAGDLGREDAVTPP